MSYVLSTLTKYKQKEREIDNMRRVVVTGMGAITPIGHSVEEFWNGVKESKV